MPNAKYFGGLPPLARSLLPLHSRVTKWFVVTRSKEGATQTVHWQTSVSRNLISGLVIFGCGFEGSFSSSEAEKGPRLIWQRPSLTPPPHSRLSPIVPPWHAPRPFVRLGVQCLNDRTRPTDFRWGFCTCDLAPEAVLPWHA